MKGHVRKRGTTWSYMFAVIEDGKRRQIQRGGYRIRKDAETALADALSAYGKGDRRAVAQPSTQQLDAYLAGWLERRSPGLKPGTAQSYGDIIRAWINPHLGKVALRDLTGERIQRWHTTLRQRGARNGKPLGSRSVQYANRVLMMALAEAVEAGDLARSPIDDVPRKQRPTHTARRVEERVWTGDQAERFLTATAEHRWHPMWSTALDTGMRRGELAALRWVDCELEDLDKAAVNVRWNRVVVGREVIEQDTKSGKPRRVSIDVETATRLRRWRTQQKAEGLAWGRAWTDTGRVFTREDGAEVHPDAISTAFEKATARVGVPPIRLHDLRHTSGTLALAAGVPPQVVQERLGHADIATTLRLYAHVLPMQQSDAAARIGAAIYGRAG